MSGCAQIRLIGAVCGYQQGDILEDGIRDALKARFAAVADRLELLELERMPAGGVIAAFNLDIERLLLRDDRFQGRVGCQAVARA